MIQIIPSIPVIQNKIIYCEQKNKVYPENPLEVAKKFENYGVKNIHFVDLEGVEKGTPVNYSVLEAIAGHTNLKIDFAGGIHTPSDIDKAFEHGAASITAGRVALSHNNAFASWIISYGREKIRLSVDALDDEIIIQGCFQEKKVGLNLMDHITYFYDLSLKYIKITDLARIGSLESPSFDFYQTLRIQFPNLYIMASGGIRSIDDIKQLDELGIHGAIFSKAYYEGAITLKELEKFLAI